MNLESSLTCIALVCAITACNGSTQIGESSGNEGGSAGSVNAGGASNAGGSAGNGTSTQGNAGTASTEGSGGTASTTGAGSGGAKQCESSKDCVRPSVPCESCPNGDQACPSVDCIDGECVSSFPTCQGTSCTEDAECPVSLAPCETCADGTTACPWARCENGSCTNGIDTCGDANPCEGKQCGDDCSACPADDPICDSLRMYCNEELECQQDEPLCNAIACENDSECPLVDACPVCADGTSCAELKCVDGTCQFQCPEDGVCAAEGESCAGGASCCSGLTCCAGVPIPEGEEYCSASDCPDSDVNLKRNFGSVDPNAILERLAALPISTWSYRAEPSTKHIGPMAQDFMASFGVGSSDRAIAKVDADGVAFAAIQALYGRLQALEAQNAKLERELSRAADSACSREPTR